MAKTKMLGSFIICGVYVAAICWYMHYLKKVMNPVKTLAEPIERKEQKKKISAQNKERARIKEAKRRLEECEKALNRLKHNAKIEGKGKTVLEFINFVEENDDLRQIVNENAIILKDLGKNKKEF